MKSGMLAAEAAFSSITDENASEKQSADAVDMSGYEKALKESWVWKELNEVRNLRPSFNSGLGLWGGMMYSGVDSFVLKGRTPWTLRNTISDAAHTKRARWILSYSIMNYGH